jgi:hypothetical protein
MDEMRVCYVCKTEKQICLFCIYKGKYTGKCRECHKEYAKKWWKGMTDAQKDAHKASTKLWRKQKRATDPEFKKRDNFWKSEWGKDKKRLDANYRSECNRRRYAAIKAKLQDPNIRAEYNAQQSKRHKYSRDVLSDGYLIKLLQKTEKFAVPRELVEIKRLQIQIYRFLKEKQNGKQCSIA